MVICSGLLALMDGIGVQKLELSRMIMPMPNFWKPGFMMMMEARPFEWVHSEFDKRLQLQHEGNPAEKTFKWALAAMYGAFARTVGWDQKRRCAPGIA